MPTRRPSRSTRSRAGAPAPRASTGRARRNASQGRTLGPAPQTADRRRLRPSGSAASQQRRSLLRPLVLGVLALLLGLGISAALRGCDLGQTQKSPYDWSNLDTSGTYFAYKEDGKVVSAVGVDVSDHQGQIDWNTVAQSGVSFALVRVGNRGTTEGGLFEDSRYRQNIQGAQEAGLIVGAYFFSQATTPQEAEEEAQFVKELLSGIELSGPVAFDLEVTPRSRVEGLTQAQATACARAFCQEVASLGTGPLIYGNSNDLELFEQELLDDYPLWYAQYQTRQPSCTLPFIMWQYTESGQVPGISTPTDLNLLMKAS